MDIYEALDHLAVILSVLRAEEILSTDDEACYDTIARYIAEKEQEECED